MMCDSKPVISSRKVSIKKTKKVESNTEGWRGCEISVTISGIYFVMMFFIKFIKILSKNSLGAWSTYRSRVLMYFQQLAVITPYAHLQLDFSCRKDDKKNFTAEFCSRSQQMPPIAREVQPHPKSLNHITLSRMLKETREKKLSHFLSKELSGISPGTASKLAESIGESSVSSLSTAKVLDALRFYFTFQIILSYFNNYDNLTIR